MLPTFPESKILELDDKRIIDDFLKKFSPFTEFIFIDLWIYNPKNDTSLSILNGNLIIKRQEYTSDSYYYTFLGTNDIYETVQQIMNWNKRGKNIPLSHIPEICIPEDREHTEIFIREDADNFDYILSIPELAHLKGAKYYDKRNLVNRFKKLYPEHEVKSLDLTNKDIQSELKELFLAWGKQKKKESEEIVIELEALEKIFSISSLCNIYGLGLYYNHSLIGFTTYHMLTKHYAGMSFEKGNTSFEGIYAYIKHEAAKRLYELGAKYLNYEQDLGIPGLKKAKQLWRPVFYFKKYTIEKGKFK